MKKNPDQPADGAELRRRAEERLSKKPGGQKPETVVKMSDVDTARLMHELQVHQIELEMQNEELQQERVQAEIFLARYIDLYDFAPVSYFALDVDGTILAVNLTGAHLVGIERSRLVNRRFALFVGEGDRHAFDGFLQRVFAGQAKVSCEVTLQQTGFQPLILHIEGTRSTNQQECRAVMMDITEHRRGQEQAQAARAEMQRLLALSEQSRRVLLSTAEDAKASWQALQQSELKYRRLYDTMTDAFVMVDMAGHFLQCNRTYCELLGYAEDELRQMTYLDITPEKWHTAEASIVKEQVLPRGYSDVYQKEYRKKDGTVLSVELRTFLIRDTAGQPNAMWAIVRDITERMQAQEKLRSARIFLESVINAIADPVFVKDDQRRFVLVNDAVCASVGRPKELLLGEDGDDMFPEDQVAIFREMDTQVFNTGKENVNEEIVSNLSTGELRTVVTRKSRFIDPEGKRFLVGVIRDITERKQAETKISEQLEELHRWQEVMLGREDRVQELKGEINELCRRTGEALRYPSQEAGSADAETAEPKS